MQYIRNLDKVTLHELFRGKPEIAADIDGEEIRRVAGLCPSGAIDAGNGSIDLGKCVFCKECQFALPAKIRFTNDYRMATNLREGLKIKAGDTSPISIDPEAVRAEIKQYFGRALKLRQVSAAGDNACEMELNAAGNVNFDMGRYGIEFLASPRHCDGIVITGPVSENMAEPLQICFDAVPNPKIVILAGTDAISGGMFAAGGAVRREFLLKYRPDLYVPGNPVHPLTFIHGVLALTRNSNANNS